MLSKYVLPGNQLELQAVGRMRSTNPTEKKKVYESQVYEIITEERLEIAMPMEKSKLILLPVDAEYDMYFYTQAGLYQCFGRVIDRYKHDMVYILLMEITSNLRKFQRREYYRFGCALEVYTRQLEQAELAAVEESGIGLVSGLPLKRSVIVDISGGGLRFVGDYRYEPDSMLYCKYQLGNDGKNNEYNLLGKVIGVRPVDNRPGFYEHRVQYVNIDTYEREEIIKFIFEEERRSRRREKNN